MIITKIRIQEEHPMTRGVNSWPLQSVDLELNPLAGANGYLLNASSGLGPPTLKKVVDGFDTYGRPIYTSISDKREMAFKVALQPGTLRSISSLRDDLYRFLSRSVRVSFMNGANVVAYSIGFVNKLEPSLFTSNPEFILTIESKKGELLSPTTIDVPVSTLNTITPTINYELGTAPVGFYMAFTVTADHTGFVFNNHANVWYEGTDPISTAFAITRNLRVGDLISISTVPGNRFIHLLDPVPGPAFDFYDLSGTINQGAVWPTLYSGVNVFNWDIATSWATITAFNYVPEYWGV